MFKKTFLFLVTVMFILGMSNLSFQAAPTQVMDVGNEICPISGERIDKETKATYEYEGKIYNFCCPMCIEEFKKDPDKYINKMEKQKTARGA